MPTGNGQPRTYSIAADTFAGNFKSSLLKDEIEAEAGITTVLLRIDRTADVIDIWFVADLSGGEITLLDAVVAAHNGGVPLPPPPAMEFVAATEASSAVNSITINVPAGVVDGDTLLLQVTQTDNEDGNIDTIAGWDNPVANAGSGGAPPSEPATSIFTRKAASEPASYVATCTNPAAVGMVAKMLAFRVGDPTTILDVSIVLGTHDNVSSPSPPPNTPVTRGCMAVAMWWHDDDLGVYGSVPSGYTDPDGLGSVVTAGGGNGASIGSAFKLLSGDATTENPGSFNVTDPDEGGTATILLRPEFEGLPTPPPPPAGDGQPTMYHVKGDTKDATYKVVGWMVFPGSVQFGIPTSVSGILFVEEEIGPVVGDARIYDATNALQIAEVTGITSQSKINIEDYGALSNISAGEAVWEFQLKRTAGVDPDDDKIKISGVAIKV